MNFNSPEWKELETKLNDQIANLDRMNRGKMDAEQTATIRGQIRALQWLLQWPEVEKAPVHSDNEVNLGV